MDTEQESPDGPLGDAIAALRDTPPARDLWPQIAPQLTARRPRGSVLMRWPTALAAGIAIAIASVGGTMALMRRGPATDGVPALATNGAGERVVAVGFTPADAALAKAIGDLETAVRTNITQIDSVARESILRSLAALDQAINDAAAQRRAEPQDAHAAKYLTSTLRKKLDLLRTVSELTTISGT